MTFVYPHLNMDDINKLQVQHMLAEIEGIKRSLKHYNKLRKRFNLSKNICKYIGLGVFVTVEVAGVGLLIVATGGTAVPLVLPAILCGAGLASPLIDLALCKYFSQRKHLYTEKCKHIQSTLDRLYIFMKDAMSDSVIDEKEINKFREIITEYNTTQIKEENGKQEKITSRATMKSVVEKIKLLESKIST